MNNIEFKILRESLHLSQTELSEIWNINIRTIQSWESGRECIPQKRIDELNRIELEIDFSAENFERQIVESRKQHNALNDIVLLAYKKQDFDYGGDFEHYKLHNCLLSRCLQRCKTMKYNCRIVLFNKEEYLKWLTGRDSQDKRAEWASLQLN
jgi:DNA-binding XRE family transcriptional regulator